MVLYSCKQIAGAQTKGVKNMGLIIEIVIVVTIVYDIIKGIKNRVDSEQTDNPDDKDLK